MEVWVPFRSISLLKLQPHPKAIEQTVLFTEQVTGRYEVCSPWGCTQGTAAVSVCQGGSTRKQTPLCRKALTHPGQSTALSLGRTAGKAPSVVQLIAVKMADNTNQFNSNFRNHSDLTSCKASISFFPQMHCFEILFALKNLVLKNIQGNWASTLVSPAVQVWVTGTSEQWEFIQNYQLSHFATLVVLHKV